MGTKPELFDVVDYLDTEDDMQAYLNAALEEDDEQFFLVALGTIARAKNISHLSKETGMSREGIYKALSGTGNPSFKTISKISKALGLKLHYAGV